MHVFSASQAVGLSVADDCIFCQIIAGRAPKCAVYEDDEFLVIMDIFPMAKGHCLIMPKAHKVRVHELSAQSRARLFNLAVAVRCAISSSSRFGEDANYIVNDGRYANQQVPHVHLHVIPRQRRDHLRLLRYMLCKALLGRGRRVAYATLEQQAEQIRRALNVP